MEGMFAGPYRECLFAWALLNIAKQHRFYCAWAPGPTMPRCLFIATSLSAALLHVGLAHVNPDRAVRDPVHDCVRVDPVAEPWVPVLLLELGTEDGRGRVVPQLYQLQQHRPVLSVRLVQQPSPTPASGPPWP